MAVVIAFRVAIALAPIGYRIINGPAPTNLFLLKNALAQWWDSIIDPDWPPESLTELLTPFGGGDLNVTDFTGTFEGRKVAVRWSRAPAGGTIEDAATTTLHFLKIDTGAPAAWVDGTDDATVESAFGTMWAGIKDAYASTVKLDVFRWSKSGPDWDITPAPYNPAYRVTEVAVAGTGGGSQLPPQVAVSVTHKTSVRKRWGRCYLPAPTTDALQSTGRLKTSSTGSNAAIHTYWLAMLEECTAAGIQPVIMSRARDAYTTEKGHEIAAQPFTAYSVEQVQVDDLFDVIRSRRYSGPTSRVVDDVTPAA